MKSALDRIWKRLDETGLTALDISRARVRLHELLLDVRLGHIPLIHAKKRLLRYKRALKAHHSNAVVGEELVRAQLLHSAIENHCGNPHPLTFRQAVADCLLEGFGFRFHTSDLFGFHGVALDTW